MVVWLLGGKFFGLGGQKSQPSALKNQDQAREEGVFGLRDEEKGWRMRA